MSYSEMEDDARERAQQKEDEMTVYMNMQKAAETSGEAAANAFIVDMLKHNAAQVDRLIGYEQKRIISWVLFFCVSIGWLLWKAMS